MKINNINMLGSKLVQRGNEIRSSKAKAKRFSMTKDEMKKNKVNIKEVKDRLGLIMTVQSLGDEIAMTIRVGQNITAMKFEHFFADGRAVLGNNAVDVALMSAELYWKVWDKELKCINREKAEEIVESRRGQHVSPIYTNKDYKLVTNKYGITRKVYRVNDFYIKRAAAFLNSINPETTLEELQQFQRDFVYITRALGEQTIDKTKDITKVLCRTMRQLISQHITVTGGFKELNSNIKTYRKNKERYTITAPAKEVEVYVDVIGEFKQVCVDTMEDMMNNYIEILEKECNLDNYKQYEDIDLTEDNVFELAKLIDTAEEIITKEEIDAEDKERLLAAIYNRASELGIEARDVIRIAIRLAISQVKTYKGQTVISSVLGTDKEYQADLWKVSMLFGDAFVAEYADVETIEVPVECSATCDIEAGTEITIEDGIGFVGEGYEDMIQVYGPYQNGAVLVKDGYVVALYNPVQELLNKYPNATIVSVDSYAVKPCRFSVWAPSTLADLENDESTGYKAAKDAQRIDIIEVSENNYGVVAIRNGKMAAAAKVEAGTIDRPLNLINQVCYKSIIVADIIK